MQTIVNSNSWADFESFQRGSTKQEKGRAFEEVCRLFLLTDPLFRSRLSHVWHHASVPQNVVDELGLQKPEIGVDLVAKTKGGSYWAIQCKYHQNSSENVTYDELSTFFSITERNQTFSKLSHRIVCTSANDISRRVGQAHSEKLAFLTSHDFAQLGQAGFDSFRAELGGKIQVPKPFEPFPHQRFAIDKATRYFFDGAKNRGKLIHPCGSGKSLTAYWIAQKLGAQCVLIAVPSLSLVRQTLTAWARETIACGSEIDWLAVCSDETVSNSDDPALQKADLGIEVTTNVADVAQFLNLVSKNLKVVVTTYQSGRIVSAAAREADFSFDLGIFDEAHKTVGRRDKAFAELLQEKNVSIARRIFMTATEREFKGDSADILSMHDREIYGDVIDFLSFKAALEQIPPILCDYKVVSVIVTKAEILDLITQNTFIKSSGKDWSAESDASAFASLIALQKLIKHGNVTHAVSFHSTIARAKDFSVLNEQASRITGFAKLSSFHVSAKDGVGSRAAEIERFKQHRPSLITNARCLTEGVDVPMIDAVVFADPKQSKIDIVQAAGRAMRRSSGKEFGYIIIPVILDGASVESASSAFSQIINVVSALGMSDERIIDEFKALVSGRSGGERIIEFLGEKLPTTIELKELLTEIQILVWDRLSFAKSTVGESDFAKWMRSETKLSEKTIKNYSQAVRKISNDLVRLKLAYSSLDEIMREEDLQNLKEEYFSIKEYKDLDERGKGMYSAGFNRLIAFHQFKVDI